MYAAVFRVFGPYQLTAIHVAALAVVAATCVVLYLITRDLAGPRLNHFVRLLLMNGVWQGVSPEWIVFFHRTGKIGAVGRDAA